jgi:hypothetical protein
MEARRTVTCDDPFTEPLHWCPGRCACYPNHRCSLDCACSSCCLGGEVSQGARVAAGQVAPWKRRTQVLRR